MPPFPRQSDQTGPLIAMEDVAVTSHGQAGQVILDEVNWALHRGEFWVLAGLHGSGKTDLLLTAAAIQPPARGLFRLFGRVWDAGGSPPPLPDRLRLGLVFDGGQLLSHLTLRENIALPLRYHGDGSLEACEQRVQTLLEFAELAEVAGRRPGEVGRNWSQRAGLARALALRPEVLLVDNPLSGLDPLQSHWWRRRLADLAAGHAVTEGTPLSLVVTTNDLRLWQRFKCKCAILKQGRLMAGSPASGAHLMEQLNQQLVGLETESN